MNISMLQSLMSRTRNEIAELHSTLDYYFGHKADAIKEGHMPLEYMCHARIKKHKKELAKLVLLKKALKEDYHHELFVAKCMSDDEMYFREI